MYDMDGLSMYDDGMGAYITPEMVKAQLYAGASGAGGILLTSAIVQRIPWDRISADPGTQSYLKVAASSLIGILGGRMIWERSPNAAMGFVGGVVGSALAQLVASMSNGALTTGLSSAGVSQADLAALEAAVTSSSPGFSPMNGLSGPVVSERALSAPGVTSESLREYAPYLS